MSSYLDLCNKVISEGGLDQTLLTTDNWASIETNKRVYPRVKRLVAEAWKMIQMNKSEWQWRTKELRVTNLPRVRYSEGGSALVAGLSLFGEESDAKFTVLNVVVQSGDLAEGNAVGYLEVKDYSGNPVPGEQFVDNLQAYCVYEGRGVYNYQDNDPSMRTIKWETFVASTVDQRAMPVKYIPWESWLYKDVSIAYSNAGIPTHVSQDLEGNVVFYPNIQTPYMIDFYYEAGPSSLVLPTDVPDGLLPEYHDWIAWLALANLAQYDKNITLYQYASKMETFYRTRAERSVMPMMAWAVSEFNKPQV